MTERWSSVLHDRTAETPRPRKILESAASGSAAVVERSPEVVFLRVHETRNVGCRNEFEAS
jgi:hypothetical protein